MRGSWATGVRYRMLDSRSARFFGCVSREDTLNWLSERLKAADAPTAAFTSNTLATRYGLSSLVSLGIKIPGDIAVAGFDDFELAELTSPSLTVVRQPAQEMGRVAANLRLDQSFAVNCRRRAIGSCCQSRSYCEDPADANTRHLL